MKVLIKAFTSTQGTWKFSMINILIDKLKAVRKKKKKILPAAGLTSKEMPGIRIDIL